MPVALDPRFRGVTGKRLDSIGLGGGATEVEWRGSAVSAR
jgi:hypothetical protein